MRKKPQDDENPRQLSLDLWGKIYNQHTVNSEEEYVDYIAEHGYSPRAEIDIKAQIEAGNVALRGTDLAWSTLRRYIWKRDKGKCQVCLREITRDQYQCGHMVDRTHGGSDRLSNLVTMCGACNQTKPLTPTKEDYWLWVKRIR